MLKKSFSKSKPVCKVTFTLPLEAAKGGQDVRILGDFNHWSWENGFRMKPGKSEFATEVELPAGKEYQFRYLIDNHIWENDWKADNYVPAAFGEFNSVLSLVEEKADVKAPAAKKAPVAKPKAVAAKAPVVAVKVPAAQTTIPAVKPVVSAAKTVVSAAKPATVKTAAPKAAPKNAGKKG
jgi:hypothetical protein